MWGGCHFFFFWIHQTFQTSLIFDLNFQRGVRLQKGIPQRNPNYHSLARNLLEDCQVRDLLIDRWL